MIRESRVGDSLIRTTTATCESLIDSSIRESSIRESSIRESMNHESIPRLGGNMLTAQGFETGLFRETGPRVTAGPWDLSRGVA